MKNGRPTKYTETLGNEICAELSRGKTLVSICASPEMPSTTTVYRWITEDEHQGFRDSYKVARENQAWHLFEEILEIADATPSKAHGEAGTGEASARVAAEKERINARKFFISKIMPRMFGDKIQQEISGKDGGAIQTEAKTIDITPELQTELDKILLVNQGMQKPEGIE